MSHKQEIKQHCFHTLNPDETTILVKKVVKSLSSLEFDRLACVDLLPLALTSLVSIELNKPFIIVRKQSKGYGTNNSVEGVLEENETLALLTFEFDDATAGIVKMLEERHCSIAKAITFQPHQDALNLSFETDCIE